MRKWIIAVVVILLLLVAAVAYALVNLNRYLEQNKDWLEAQVEAALGREVSFESVSVSLSGGLGARVTKLRIADDPRFSKSDFVRANDVQVVVGIIPALFRRYEVRRIVLDSPVLAIIRTESGFNFETMGKPTPAPGGENKKEKKEEGEPARKMPEQAPPSSAATTAFIIAKTDIRGAELHYVDRTTRPPTDVMIKKLDFSASNVSLESPVKLDIAAALFGSDDQNMKLSGTVGPLGSPPNVQAAPLDLKLDLGPIVIDRVKALPALAGSIPPELSSSDPISLQASIKGTQQKLTIDTSGDATRAKLVYGSSFLKPAGTTMKLAIDATRSGDTLQLQNLALRLKDLELKGKGTVRTGEPGAVDLTIDSNRASLDGWGEMIPPLAEHEMSGQFELHVHAKGSLGKQETPALDGAVVLQDVNAKLKGSPYEIEALSTRVEFDKDALVIPPTSFRLGGSPVKAQAKIVSLRSRRGSFALESPQLRAASLGLAGQDLKKEEVIRGLDLSGSFAAPTGATPEVQAKLQSEGGTLRDVDYQNLRADFGMREQVATINRIALKAFEGTYDGSGRYDMRDPEMPRFDFRSNVRDMVLKQLLGERFPGAQEKIEGKLDADLELQGEGKKWETIQRALRGEGRVDVKNGVLKDVNIAEQVLTGVTGISGLSNFVSPRTRQKYPEIFETGDTRFDKLGGTVQIADGQARTDDVTMSARDYAILGKGTFAFENRLDFVATLVASQMLTEDVIHDVKEAKYITNEQGRVAIPFRLTGSLPNVRPKPDTEFIARAIGRAAIEKGVEKGLDKLLGGKKKREEVSPEGTPAPQKPEDMLRKGLEGLFNR